MITNAERGRNRGRQSFPRSSFSSFLHDVLHLRPSLAGFVLELFQILFGLQFHFIHLSSFLQFEKLFDGQVVGVFQFKKGAFGRVGFVLLHGIIVGLPSVQLFETHEAPVKFPTRSEVK